MLFSFLQYVPQWSPCSLSSARSCGFVDMINYYTSCLPAYSDLLQWLILTGAPWRFPVRARLTFKPLHYSTSHWSCVISHLEILSGDRELTCVKRTFRQASRGKQRPEYYIFELIDFFCLGYQYWSVSWQRFWISTGSDVISFGEQRSIFCLPNNRARSKWHACNMLPIEGIIMEHSAITFKIQTVNAI